MALENGQSDGELRFTGFSIDQIADAVFWISLEGRILNVNAAACAMLGYSREELLSLTVLDLDPGYAREYIPADVEALRRTGCKHSTRYCTTKDGCRISVEITSNYLMCDDGEYVCSVVRNISDRVKAEREASFFRALIEYTRDPVYVLDPGDGGRMVYVNQAACSHYGLEREKLLTMRITDWDPQFDITTLPGIWEDLKQGQSRCSERVHRVASGELVPVEVTSNYLEHDGREYIAGYFHDIRERKRTEDVLRMSEERYRGLVELFPDAIYVHSGGRLVFVNPQGARLLGADRPEDLYGREALEFVHPDYRDFVRRRIARAFEQGSVNSPVEQLFLRLDGTAVPVEVSSTAYTYGGQKALQVIARDISERKRIQEELLRAQKLESLGVLTGGIAHDFNNILTGILGNLSISRLQVDSSHPIAGHLEQCEKASLQAAELARQLLTFSRGGEPVKKLFSPVPLLRDAASFTLRGSNVRSVTEMADDLWSLEADEGQIGQVLNNLLLNAVQAMPSGGEVCIRGTNERLFEENRQLLPAGAYVRIEVEDHGCGISPENLAKVFDPYFTTKSQGSGLGLSSVYSIVRKHGGAVEVVSTPGKGSCFTIHLPAAPGEQPEPAAVKECGRLGGSGRVLVMDDEQLVRDVATAILRHLGYEAESCSDGCDAVERYRLAWEEGAPFSAVILDLTIPDGMGGREAAARILEIDPRAVLVVSSGYSNDTVAANFRDYGFSGAIPKPFDVHQLAGELARLLPRQEGGTR
jgi:PAS domain S-box-containing protein